jgi:hypothetical protein
VHTDETVIKIEFLRPVLFVTVFGFLNTGYCDEVKDSLALLNFGIKWYLKSAEPGNAEDSSIKFIGSRVHQT